MNSNYKPIPKWKIRLLNLFFPDKLLPVDEINLGKVGFKTTCVVDDKDKNTKMDFAGESTAENWFINSPGGIGHFNRELYNKIKDYQKWK